MYNFFGYVVNKLIYIEMWKGNILVIKKIWQANKNIGRSSPKILHSDKFHNTAEVINIDRQKAKKYG